MRRLRDAGLVNSDKVKLDVGDISFLGHSHIFSPGGISIDSERTRAIRDFPPPRDVRGVARFLGMANI